MKARIQTKKLGALMAQTPRNMQWAVENWCYIFKQEDTNFIKGSVAERSKAADSSSVIVRCACSNHAGVNIFGPICHGRCFFFYREC